MRHDRTDSGIGAPTDEPIDPGLGPRVFNRRTIVWFAIGIAILVALVTQLDLDVGRIIDTIRRADPSAFLAALFVYYLTFPFRGWRWRRMLRNAGIENPPGIGVLSMIIFLSWFANCLVPAKLGDVYRAYLLKKRGAVSLSFAGGTVVAERLIDLAFVLIVLGASALAIFRGRVPDRLGPFLEIGALGIFAAGLGLLALRRWPNLAARFLPRRFHAIYDRFQGGTLGAFGSYGQLVVLTSLGWLAEIVRFWLVGVSLGLFANETVWSQLAISAFVALGSAIFTTAAPTPGGLGAAELAIVAALTLVGRGGEIAIAAALLDRLISYWSLIAFGTVAYFGWAVRDPDRGSSSVGTLSHARRD
ncbi:MAG: flippase-like domain-containing protein [Chloroflexota bacterium]|nr:MAG: flippase-like domain-containing protein [Chloroflexota bacterium]